jgi:hypothetical protein
VRRFLAPLCLVLALSALPAAAVQKVPISFDDFHGYTGAVAYIKQVAAAYPEITELIQIGQSNLHKRPIYVLVVSNMRTGTTIEQHVNLSHMRNLEVKDIPRFKPYVGKPGHYIDGGMHGNEYTGSEVCLYIIDKLVSGYGADAEITRLVDNDCFYVNPAVNPDGMFNSAEKEISQRGNSFAIDDDKDGKINEDGPDDLDGDGHIVTFRYKNPKGEYVCDDQDPRLMVRLAAGATTTKTRYSVVPEDKDNDGDGRRGEDSEAGGDVNRNFPEGWWTSEGTPGGSGSYPTAYPEAQALVEFAVNHRNILMVQNFHTSGGFTYRVPGTAADSTLSPKDVAVYDLILGRKYLEIIGQPVPEAWLHPDRMADFKAQLRTTSRNKYAVDRGYEMPRGWIMGYNEERDQRYGYGMVIDWWFQQYGALAVTTELWNPEADVAGFPKIDSRSPDARIERERAQLKMSDERFGGKLFVPWHPFTHPELGPGELGGWNSKYRSNAWPGQPLRDVCEKHWQFELFRAGLLPQIAVASASAKVLYSASSPSEAKAIMDGDTVTIRKAGRKGKIKVVEVTAVIENRGKLATQLARGAQLEGNREDVVWLIGDRGKLTFLQGDPATRLGVLDGTMPIPGTAPAAGPGQRGQRGAVGAAPAPTPQMPAIMAQRGQRGMRGMGARGAAQPQQTGPRREVRWLVAIEGDSPLKIVATSEKGGTVVKALDVK